MGEATRPIAQGSVVHSAQAERFHAAIRADEKHSAHPPMKSHHCAGQLGIPEIPGLWRVRPLIENRQIAVVYEEAITPFPVKLARGLCVPPEPLIRTS